MHAVDQRDSSPDSSLQEPPSEQDEKKEEIVTVMAPQFEVVSEEEVNGYSKFVENSSKQLVYADDYKKGNVNDYDSHGAVMTGLKNNDLAVVKHALRTNTWSPHHPCRETLWKEICTHLHKAGGGDVYLELESTVLGESKYTYTYTFVHV